MQTTAPSVVQGTQVLEGAGAVSTPVPPTGMATLETAAALEAATGAAVAVMTRVVKDVGSATADDAPGAKTPPGLDVAAGMETALVAAGTLAATDEAPPVAEAPPAAEPRVPAPAPSFVMAAQSPLRDVPIAVDSLVSTESPGLGN